jgi:hypothetical protein
MILARKTFPVPLPNPRGHANMTQSTPNIIFWHRELPPIAAEPMDEHIVEADSARVAGTIAHRDELWDQYYEDLMSKVRARLEQEVLRLGGHYAHVLDETVESHHSDASNESWLHGRFTYMLYRQAKR